MGALRRRLARTLALAAGVAALDWSAASAQTESTVLPEINVTNTRLVGGASGGYVAGRQEIVPGRHATPPWISPFADDPTGRTSGTLLPQISPGPLAEVGAGDHGIMSYGYRVCLSQAADRIRCRELLAAKAGDEASAADFAAGLEAPIHTHQSAPRRQMAFSFH